MPLVLREDPGFLLSILGFVLYLAVLMREGWRYAHSERASMHDALFWGCVVFTPLCLYVLTASFLKRWQGTHLTSITIRVLSLLAVYISLSLFIGVQSKAIFQGPGWLAVLLLLWTAVPGALLISMLHRAAVDRRANTSEDSP